MEKKKSKPAWLLVIVIIVIILIVRSIIMSIPRVERRLSVAQQEKIDATRDLLLENESEEVTPAEIDEEAVLDIISFCLPDGARDAILETHTLYVSGALPAPIDPHSPIISDTGPFLIVLLPIEAEESLSLATIAFRDDFICRLFNPDNDNTPWDEDNGYDIVGTWDAIE